MCEGEKATQLKDCMSVCTTRGRTPRRDWCTEIAQPIRLMTGKYQLRWRKSHREREREDH